MSYSLSDTYADVASKPARPNYLPPHQRHTYIPDQTDRGGRTGGRGIQQRYNRNPNQYYHSVSQQFNELKLAEQDNTNTAINFDAYEDIPVDITGSDVPEPVNTFTDIDLGEILNDNIENRCKYVKPTPIQRYAIPVALAGRDLMACAQTGSGKTAAFCFPIISGIMKTKSSYGRRETVAYPLALILSPTRELCCQIFDEATKFCFRTGVKVAAVYGGSPIYPQLRTLEKGVDILVATPGRLTDLIERSKVSLRKIKYLALDEADRMLDMGFEPQIRKIVERLDMPPSGSRQTLLFSATFPTEIKRMAADFLQNYVFLSVGRVGSSTDLIQQKIVFVEDYEKREYLSNLLHDQKANGNLGKNALTLIFVETKRSADALENWLCSIGFPATAIHGDKVQYERERALRSFKNGVTPILVATDVASRGLDIPQVAHVINFDLPRDIDSYVHRIGRTGRAGKSGLATAFFNAKNSGVARLIAELMKEAHQEAPNWLDQYAEGHSSASDSRYGSSKFGGRDFRSGNDGSYGNADYGGSSYGGYEYYAPPPVAAGFSDSYGGGYVGDGGYDYVGGDGGGGGGGGYESVVGTGWE